MRRTHEELFGKLVGKTVHRIVVATPAPMSLGYGEEPEWGLLFTDGTVAWVDRDAEGNGPGWLTIQAVK
jgi:hypothetical protein